MYQSQVPLFIESLTYKLPRAPLPSDFPTTAGYLQGQECAALTAVHRFRCSLTEGKPIHEFLPSVPVLSSPRESPSVPLDCLSQVGLQTCADGDETLPVAANKCQGNNNTSFPDRHTDFLHPLSFSVTRLLMGFSLSTSHRKGDPRTKRSTQSSDQGSQARAASCVCQDRNEQLGLLRADSPSPSFCVPGAGGRCCLAWG